MSGTQGLLEKFIQLEVSRKASSAVTAGLAVALDASDDPQGFSVKPVAALDDIIVGVAVDSIDEDGVGGIALSPSIVPMTCVDANIAPGVKVYNTSGGKCSSTNGTNSTLLGVTFGSTNGANQLVSVRLTF
jgi:hypothetical protein